MALRTRWTGQGVRPPARSTAGLTRRRPHAPAPSRAAYARRMSSARSEPTDEARFADAVAVANIPTLLMVLVQLTGDPRWLHDPYRPVRPRGMGDNDSGGMPDAVQQEIRDAALAAILAWRAGRP